MLEANFVSVIGMPVWFHENSFLGLNFVLLLHDFKIIKYFGMNDNELIIGKFFFRETVINLITHADDICIYKKNLLKNIYDVFTKKIDIFIFDPYKFYQYKRCLVIEFA